MVAADSEPALLREEDGPAAEVINGQADGPLVLACEHASRRIPVALRDLDLAPGALTSHIAWDPGALAVAKHLSAALDAALVAPRFSRLVFDCNRPPGPAGVATLSEDIPIPGNLDLTPEQLSARVNAVYEPFRRTLAETIEARLQRPRPAVLVTIHSFTPVFLGRRRDVQVGILHDADSRLADAMLARAADVLGLDTRRNEPYGPRDGVTHTLREHALRHSIANVMIEIRNDLIADDAGIRTMAAGLTRLLRLAIDDLQPNPAA